MLKLTGCFCMVNISYSIVHLCAIFLLDVSTTRGGALSSREGHL